MASLIEKIGFTSKQAFGLATIVLLLIGGMVLPESAYEYFFSGTTEVSRDVIRAEIEDYIDHGLGGSPWQTEKTGQYLMGTVGANYYILNGTSGKLWFYSNSEANVKTWIRGNTSGEFLWVTNISESSGYVFEADGLSNNNSLGEYVWGQAGETLDYGDIVYMETDGDYNLADANNTANMYAVAMAAEDISNTAWGFFLIKGYARCDSWPVLTIGSRNTVLTDWDPGGITQTLPTETGDLVQRIGYPIASKIVYFDFDSTVVELS